MMIADKLIKIYSKSQTTANSQNDHKNCQKSTDKIFTLKDQKEKEEFYGIQHSWQNENSKAKAYGS